MKKKVKTSSAYLRAMLGFERIRSAYNQTAIHPRTTFTKAQRQTKFHAKFTTKASLEPKTLKPIPAKEAFGKVCDDCAHCFNSPETQQDHCQLFVDPITGQEALCSEARAYEDICGPNAKHFQRRQNIAAIVENAPITAQYESATATGNEPLDPGKQSNEHVTAYHPNHPEIMNRIHRSGDKLKPFTDYTPE